VSANSKSQAIRYVAESMLACEVATGQTVADLMRAGFKCEDARAPETAELPLQPATPNGGYTEPVDKLGRPQPTAAENLDALDRVLDDANRVDTVKIEGIDNVF